MSRKRLNGCGKSTLLKLVAGILCPDDGKIKFNGELLKSESEIETERKVIYCPQETHERYDTLSGGEKKRIQYIIFIFM